MMTALSSVISVAGLACFAFTRPSAQQYHPAIAVPGEYLHLADLLRRVLPELGEMYETVPKHYDDAAWVGARLVEILPISLGDKQACLEMLDPLDRLARVSPLIRREEES